MPTKRQVLELLKRDELLTALDAYDLTVYDRRQRALLVDALGRSRKAPLAEILTALSRNRLKEICRDLGLDDSGREKALIASRLTGQAPSSGAGTGHKAGGPKRKARRKTAEGQLDLALETAEAVAHEAHDAAEHGKLTREQLERYLWSAADILRGSIDSSDYKNYIFGLLFLKRLSDRFEEECEALVAEGYDPHDPDEHQFFVPERLDAAPPGAALLRGRPQERQALGARHARVRLRIPDREVRRRRRQEGRRVLHAEHGGASDRGDPGAAGGHAHLRPDLRLGRHADPKRRVRAPPQRHAQLQPLRSGEEPRHLGDLQDEHVAPRSGGRAHREGRHAARSQALAGRRADALRPGDRQSAVLARRLGPRGGRGRRLRPLPLRHPTEDQGGSRVRAAHGGDAQHAREARGGDAAWGAVSGVERGEDPA